MPTASPSMDPAQAEAEAKQKVGLDESQPTSNIQVLKVDSIFKKIAPSLVHSHTL